MTICSQCNQIIKGNLAITCICAGNNKFCSQKCLTDWHEENRQEIESNEQK